METIDAFFQNSTNRIASSLDISIAMQRLKDYIEDHLPVSGLIIGAYDPNLKIYNVITNITPSDIPDASGTISAPMEFWEFLKRELAQGTGVDIVNSGMEFQEQDQNLYQLRKLMESHDIPAKYSILAMHLFIEKERLGFLFSITDSDAGYTQAHAELIAPLKDPISLAVSNYLQYEKNVRLNSLLEDENQYLHGKIENSAVDAVIGSETGLKAVMQMVTQIAPLNSPVMLLGETGVGKEVLANTVHFMSQRKRRPLIKVNCGAIPDSLIESELFGHEKGAFTGASASRKGRFEQADKGTIFLDEIGELPLKAQVKLLRVLQEQEIERVGGTTVRPINVRIISATNRNLEEMVRTGQFREDLWFRLNVCPITIPPLRQRLMDIPAFVKHFIELKNREFRLKELPLLAPGAMEELQEYAWPGNVRELGNIVERALIRQQIEGTGTPLRFDLPWAQKKRNDSFKPARYASNMSLDSVISAHILQALEQTKGRIAGGKGAAKLLGMNPSTLRSRMRKMKISFRRKFELNR